MAFRSESVHLTRLGSPLRDRTSAFLIVGFIAGALYLNALPNQFAYDDHHIISVNTAIHSIETLPGSLVAPYWPDEYGEELGLWRPVTTGLLGIQYILGGGDALLFHTVNLLIHMVTSVLVQRETGGNLAEILGQISSVVRNRFKLHRKVKTMSAEGRMSAWVLALVPMGLFVTMSIVNPNYLPILLDDPMGQILFVVQGVGQEQVGQIW